MIGKARSKARLPLDEQGKPERCYTHQSESLNNMLTRRKEAFIKTDKGKQDLSKLQFTTAVSSSQRINIRSKSSRRLFMAEARNMSSRTYANI